MRTGSSQREKPEKTELRRKRWELASLESELAQRELRLATLEAELRTFEAQYVHTVGTRFAELDALEAQIAEMQIWLNPSDSEARTRAAQARAKAQQTALSIEGTQTPQQRTFSPSEALKALYREVAKRIHPDLTLDAKERSLRQDMMTEANRAYEKGRADKLEAILDEWESSPEAVGGKGTAADLIRVIRKITQVRERLHLIRARMVRLKKSAVYELKERAEEAEKNGRSLLEELAEEIARRTEKAGWQLDRLKSRETVRE
jgi:hypothetical protein